MIDRRPALIASLREHRRRGGDDRLRAPARPAARRARRRPQRRRPRRRRRRRRPRPLAAERGRGRRRQRAPCASAAAAPGARSTRRRTSTASPTPSRDHLDDRRRRAHARRRASVTCRRSCGLTIDNLLEAEVVLADGSTGARERRREPGPVLGDPRRRRQLRRRHRRSRSAPTRCSIVHRRPDVLADRADRRGDAVVPRVPPAQPRELNGFFATMTVPPGRLPAGGAARAQGLRRDLVLQRRRGDGRRRCSARCTTSARRCCTASGPVPFPALQSLFDGALPARAASGTGARTSCASLPDAAIEQHVEFAERLPTLHSDDAHVPDRRRGARRRHRATRRSATATRTGPR